MGEPSWAHIPSIRLLSILRYCKWVAILDNFTAILNLSKALCFCSRPIFHCKLYFWTKLKGNWATTLFCLLYSHLSCIVSKWQTLLWQQILLLCNKTFQSPDRKHRQRWIIMQSQSISLSTGQCPIVGHWLTLSTLLTWEGVVTFACYSCWFFLSPLRSEWMIIREPIKNTLMCQLSFWTLAPIYRHNSVVDALRLSQRPPVDLFPLISIWRP